MTTTITIHRGEISIVQRMIRQTKNKHKRKLIGSLYGLQAESGQPIVLLICGGKKVKHLRVCQEYLKSKHGLGQLGRWFVSDDEGSSLKSISKGRISLVFDMNGNLSTAYDAEGHGANLEILGGNSALRLYKPLTDKLCKLLKTDSSPVHDVVERKVDDEIIPSDYTNKASPKDDRRPYQDDYDRSSSSKERYQRQTLYRDNQTSHSVREIYKKGESRGKQDVVNYSYSYPTKDRSGRPCQDDYQRIQKSGDSRRYTAQDDETRTVNPYMNDNNDAYNHTSKRQWYNTDRQLLAELLKLIGSFGRSSPEISRNSATENMSILFTYHKHYWVIEFPSTFPLGETTVLKMYADGDRAHARVERFKCDSFVDLQIIKDRISEAVRSLESPRYSYQYETYL